MGLAGSAVQIASTTRRRSTPFSSRAPTGIHFAARSPSCALKYDWWSQPYLWIPDVHKNEHAALPLRLDRGDFGSGAVHEVAGMPGPDSDHWQAIVGGSSGLAIQTKPLTFTWDELLAFINDRSVDRWTFETAHRWKYERN
jgi:hypothetical protein